MDGLVSTGKFISLHNIKNNFDYQKKNSHKFYTHFLTNCGNPLLCFKIKRSLLKFILFEFYAL